MKPNFIFVSVVAFAIVNFYKPAPAQEPIAGWQLVWQDEFNGDKLDYRKWECEINAFGGGNNELQLYTDRKDNVRVENGSLVIDSQERRSLGTIGPKLRHLAKHCNASTVSSGSNLIASQMWYVS